MSVEKDEFRRALGHFASAVTVVTSKGDDGELAGITVTAFTSLSLEPPLVMVAIDKRARMHDRLPVGGAFAVNILADDQEVVSRRFATRSPNAFQETGYREGSLGSPLLEGTIAGIECRITDRLPTGDHTIIVGEVESTRIVEGKPLMYYRGGYTNLV